MKQTAVEFYRINLIALVSTGKTDFKTEPEIFEQAKEIEKKQIIDALKMGVNIELGINEFKDLHLTYNQAFEKYIKDNYED